MALLAQGIQVQMVYQSGNCDRSALYALKNVNGGDTVDVGDTLQVVKLAGFVGVTDITFIAQGTAITGTVITVPTGPIHDAVWLIVVGVAN